MSVRKSFGLLFVAVWVPALHAQTIQVPGVGWEGQGADVVMVQLDNNPRPDMILMAYDAPDRDNSFRYRVGLNLDAAGVASSWLSGFIQVPGVGWEGQGAGATVADLDGNGRPELVLLAYDNPAKANSFRYKVGWNLNAQGRATRWTSHAEVPGVGWEGQGAAVVIGQIDANPRPDMIFVAYDNPARDNTFRYRVGFNVNALGNASWSSNYIQVPGVGWEGQGVGAALVNLDGNARPDLILMAYDNPSRDNSFRYRVGLNLDRNGVAQSWQRGFQSVPGVGWEGQGAGLAVTCLDSDPRADWVVMAYDNPSRDNSFRYRVLANHSQAPCPRPVGVATTGVALRKSITQLTAPELASLRRGFRQMIEWNSAPRDSANYHRSLEYWANMHSYMGSGCASAAGLNNPGMSGLTAHSMSNPVESATWCKCQHGTLQFLTWHRMYIFYFEQVLQAAAGDPNLRLPFFDYETNGQLPLAYRDGTAASNPLRIDNRQANLNSGSGSLSSSVTSTSGAMGLTTYTSFNGALEQTPHGSVHCAIGVNSCPSGYMGYVPSAGNDPIFYSHHANIDRLYECWLRVNPSSRLPNNAAQLDTTFTFIDGSGNSVTRRVRDMLTTAQLGYDYAAGGGCPASFSATHPVLAASEAVEPTRKFAMQGETTLQRGTTVVPLRIPSEMRSQLFKSQTDKALTPRSMLVIDGLAFDEPPRVLYEVYLRSSNGERALVGVINFFNLTGPHTHHGAGNAPDRFTFDATDALRALGGDDDVKLEFVPTTGLNDSSVSKAVESISKGANVRFREISIEVLP